MIPLTATFPDALKQSHRALFEELEGLVRAARATAEDRPAELVGPLEAARKEVLEHFCFEEENGYMALVLQIKPNLSRSVGQLHEEHGKLRESLEAVVGEVGASTALTGALRQKVLDWVDALRRHERSENVLVQDAFNLDLAAED
jgi:hypothetical protein